MTARAPGPRLLASRRGAALPARLVLAGAVILSSGSGDGAAARPADRPRIVVSLRGCTLRLEPGEGRPARVFPVGLGRETPSGVAAPRGTLLTGDDPRDQRYYVGARWLPAYHRGLPFVRLDRSRPGAGGELQRPFGMHGPVTPTLIWGHVSRGCVRLLPRHLVEVYRVAVRHPSMPVTFVDEEDIVAGRAVEPTRDLPEVAGCPEAAVGARRLRRLASGETVHDRLCGGVDHWFSIELRPGEVVSATLSQGGSLRLELYGIRAISSVASGTTSLVHRSPLARRARGDRFLRVLTAADGKGFQPYVLRLDATPTAGAPAR